MPDSHFVALHTYGREKQRDQSCFKLGKGVNADILLKLFVNRAVDLTPPHASYRYIHLDMKGATTHQYYLVLQVTSTEKDQIERFTRTQGHFVTVYLWESEGRRWLQFPCAPQAHYIDPSSYGGGQPRFPPSAAPFLTPSRMEAENPVGSDQKLTVERSGDWWWIAGDTYPHKDALKAAGARWSKMRRQWYYKGQTLPTAIHDLTTPSQVEAPALSVDIEMSPVPDSTATPAPVIVLPTPPDNIQFAIQKLKEAPKPSPTPRAILSVKGTGTIAQEYVGELTGSITGNVHCFGYAVDQGVCVYLNFGGPRTAVEAVRAKLSKGDVVTCVPWEGAGVELTAGEGNTGKYRDFMQNISEARYTSVILLHELLVAPNYGGKSRTYLVCTDETQRIAMLKYHITQLVKVPVFDAWSNYLWEAGTLASLVVQPKRAGGIDLWKVELDADAWTRLICGGIHESMICLPG